MLIREHRRKWLPLGLLACGVSYISLVNTVYAESALFHQAQAVGEKTKPVTLSGVNLPPPHSSHLSPDELAAFIRRHREAAASFGGRPASEDPIAQIDACMAAEMEEADIPGAALALVVDGELVYERGYGVKHREEGDAVDAETLFRFGSVQKMMTAAAIMSQVEGGSVALDEPVTNFVPELRFAGRWHADDITVAHLLTNTAAIPEVDIDALECESEQTSSWAACLKDAYLFAPAGSFWNYSNTGFALAGLITERVSGLPYQRLVREHIWEPAGMMATTLSPNEVIAYGNYTHGHEVDPETGEMVIFAPDSYDSERLAPTGGGFATAGDLARWAMLMMAGGSGVLSPESVEAMQAHQVSMNLLPGQDYGYGIFAEPYQDLEIRHHGGEIPGWSAFLLWAPEEQFAVAVLSNGGTGTSPQFTALCALEAVLQPEPQEEPDYSTDPKTWQRYRGVYLVRDYTDGTVDSGGEVRLAYFAHTGDQLMLTLFNRENREIGVFPVKQLFLDTFFVDFDGDGELFGDVAEMLTFIEGSVHPGQKTMWARNRAYVGRRLSKSPAGHAEPGMPSIILQDDFWSEEIQRLEGDIEP